MSLATIVHHRKAMIASGSHSPAGFHHAKLAAAATRKWRETNTLSLVK